MGRAGVQVAERVGHLGGEGRGQPVAPYQRPPVGAKDLQQGLPRQPQLRPDDPARDGRRAGRPQAGHLDQLPTVHPLVTAGRLPGATEPRSPVRPEGCVQAADHRADAVEVLHPQPLAAVPREVQLPHGLDEPAVLQLGIVVADGQRGRQRPGLQPQGVVVPVVQDVQVQQFIQRPSPAEQHQSGHVSQQSAPAPVVVQPVVQRGCGFGHLAPAVVAARLAGEGFEVLPQPFRRQAEATLTRQVPGLAQRQGEVLEIALAVGLVRPHEGVRQGLFEHGQDAVAPWPAEAEALAAEVVQLSRCDPQPGVSLRDPHCPHRPHLRAAGPAGHPRPPAPAAKGGILLVETAAHKQPCAFPGPRGVPTAQPAGHAPSNRQAGVLARSP